MCVHDVSVQSSQVWTVSTKLQPSVHSTLKHRSSRITTSANSTLQSSPLSETLQPHHYIS